ncbi:hypothetical protein CEXT_295751 [Caerostris extrusa]|uniref:Uncharacterized protein n=1 Tax=Caerostris extrusa TaxID=172846 RepID=A0AAV4YDL9_CAEEX|nr:hypothetical protein CEXT_295751 [Caerostris extrusa]
MQNLNSIKGITCKVYCITASESYHRPNNEKNVVGDEMGDGRTRRAYTHTYRKKEKKRTEFLKSFNRFPCMAVCSASIEESLFLLSNGGGHLYAEHLLLSFPRFFALSPFKK